MDEWEEEVSNFTVTVPAKTSHMLKLIKSDVAVFDME